MEYIIIITLIAALGYYFFQRNQTQNLKENGIKVTGTIVHNGQSGSGSNFRLGGNINNPTIQFVTKDGQEILGKPIVGFISQHEVIVPSNIDIIYDPKNPKRFCIDLN